MRPQRFGKQERAKRRLKRRLLVLVAGALFLIPVCVGAALAYSSSNSSVIAEGITVGAVDVGGLEVTAARKKVQAAWLTPLDRPVTVSHQSADFILTPEQAKLGVNVDAAVDSALERTRSGNPFDHLQRKLKGGRIDKNIPLKVTYSKSSINDFVERIESTVNRSAVDASLRFAKGKFTKQPSQTGREVAADALRAKLRRIVVDREGERSFAADVRVVQPKVPLNRLGSRYPTVLIVERKNFKLTLYKELKQVKQYSVAVGDKKHKTPTGLFNITAKQVDPPWFVPKSDWAGDMAGKEVPGGHPKNPLKARWLGIADGVGIHGTAAPDSIGSAASKGCIRMKVKDVKDLYDKVPVGAPVYIH